MLAPLRQTDNIPTVNLLIRIIKYSQAKVSVAHISDHYFKNRAYLFILRSFSVIALT